MLQGATKELKKAAPAIKKAAPSLPSLPSLNKAAPKNIKKEVKKAAPSLPSLPSLKKAAPSLPSFKAPSLPKAPASLKSVRKAVAAPIKKAVPKRSVGTQKVGTKRFGGGRKQTGDFPRGNKPLACTLITLDCTLTMHYGRARTMHDMPAAHGAPARRQPSTRAVCWAQAAMPCGSQTQSGRRGWTAPCQATGALTPWASPSPPSTCR